MSEVKFCWDLEGFYYALQRRAWDGASNWRVDIDENPSKLLITVQSNFNPTGYFYVCLHRTGFDFQAANTCMGFGANLSSVAGWGLEEEMRRILQWISECELSPHHPAMDDDQMIWKTRLAIVGMSGGRLCAPIPNSPDLSGYLRDMSEVKFGWDLEEFYYALQRRAWDGASNWRVDIDENPSKLLITVQSYFNTTSYFYVCLHRTGFDFQAANTCMGFGANLSSVAGWGLEEEMHRILQWISECELSPHHPALDDDQMIWKTRLAIVGMSGGHLCAPIPNSPDLSGYLGDMSEVKFGWDLEEFYYALQRRAWDGASNWRVDIDENPSKLLITVQSYFNTTRYFYVCLHRTGFDFQAANTCMGFGANLSSVAGWGLEEEMHRILQWISECELSPHHPAMDDDQMIWKTRLAIVGMSGGSGGRLCGALWLVIFIVIYAVGNLRFPR